MRPWLVGFAFVIAACQHDPPKCPVNGDVVSFDPKLLRKVLQDMAGGDVFVLKAAPGGFPEYREIVAAAKARDREVVDAAPFCEREIVVRHGAIAASGRIHGTSPQRMTTIVSQYVGEGDLPAPGTTDVAIGIELANRLGVHVGDSIDIQIAADPAIGSDHASEFHSVRIAALLRMGGLQLDHELVVTSFSAAQQWLGQGDVATGVEIRLAHDTAAHRVAKALEAKLGPEYRAEDWCELNRELLGCTWHD